METSSEYPYNGYETQYPETETRQNEDPEVISTDQDYEDRYRQNEQEEEEDEEEREEEVKKSSNTGKIAAIVILTVLLGGSMAGNYYLYDDNESLNALRSEEKIRIDTLIAVKAQVEKQLEETKATIATYQAESDNARSMLDAANAEIAKMQRNVNRLAREKASVQAFQAQLAEAKALDETLHTQIKALSDELTVVKAENSALKDSITLLTEAKKQLAARIQEATGIQAHSIKVESMARRKKDQFEFTEKASRTNRIAISFELSQNKLAPTGKRNLHVLIIAPSGDVLSGSDAKFTIQPDGTESAFTRNKEVDYPPTGGKIFFNWDETKEYQKGNYKVEIYCDGTQIGEGTVALK